MSRFTMALATTALSALPFAAMAEGVALVIGNSDYAAAPSATTAFNDTRRVARVLGDAGYEVLRGQDLNRGSFGDLLQEFALRSEGQSPLVVYFSGHALRVDGQTFLAPVDLEPKSKVDVTLGAIPLDLVLSLASARAGQSVVLLDVAQHAGFKPTGYAKPGFADLEDQNAILVVSAAAPGRSIRRGDKDRSDFSKLVVQKLMAPGATLADAASGLGDDVWISGSVDEDLTLVAEPDPAISDIARQIELAFWERAEKTKAKEDYQAYLTRYPDGAFANQARKRLGQAEVKPNPAAEAERELRLTRSERRRTQAALKLSGFDPKGIDGIFGPNTRAALAAWQDSTGFKSTGYLTERQFARLERDGERLRVKFAKERERKEREFWRATGADGTASGYRKYLRRYPEGIHAERAIAGLERLAAKSDTAEEKAERAAYQAAVRSGTPQAFRDFVKAYPDGNYTAAAKRELKRLNAQQVVKRHRATEKKLGLDQPSRLSLEQRLAYLGFNPGPRDGAFDRETRIALKAYQEDRGLAPTGFFDRDTVALVVQESSGRSGSGNVLQNLIGTVTR